MRHRNKVAVISGAASGIGQAFAERLASEGADIVVADLRSADETLKRAEALGRRTLGVVCDIGDPAQVADLGRQVELAFGRCDILVNNAGIFPPRPFEQLTFEEWRRMMTINLDSVFLMSRCFVPGMRERRWGRIVNMASNTFGQMAPGLTAYIASKGGVIGFTRALASELGADGITVNAIAPGLTRTPGATEMAGNYRGLPADEMFDTLARRQSIPRPQVPGDLVGTLSFLASEDAAFITAQTLYVDGGLVRA